jgi:hypothetical protein
MQTQRLASLSSVSQNCKSYSNDQLLTHLQDLAASERKVYAEVLTALEEVEIRKLYLARGYPSLFSFCTEFLKYSASAAQRRIESMRLLKNFPLPQKKDVQERIEKGSLNLTHLSQVAKVVRDLPCVQTCDEKMKLIARVENTSSRECEQKLMEVGAPSFSKREVLRVVQMKEGTPIYRLSVNLDEKSKELLEQFIALTAHQNPFCSKEKALRMALQIALSEVERKKKGEKRPLPPKNIKHSVAAEKHLVASESEVRSKLKASNPEAGNKLVSSTSASVVSNKSEPSPCQKGRYILKK